MQDLYEVKDEFYIPEEAQVNSGLVAYLIGVAGSKSEAIAQAIKEYKNREAELEMVKAEIGTLRERANKLESSMDKHKELLRMLTPAGEKVTTGPGRVSWRKDRALKIDNEFDIPDVYWKTKRELSRSRLIDDLKCGATIPGVALEPCIHIIIK